MAIQYAIGDATVPMSDRPTVIMHLCNNVGVMNGGFVLPLRIRYPVNREFYELWYSLLQSKVLVPTGWQYIPMLDGSATQLYVSGSMQLGEFMVYPHAPTAHTSDLWIANLIGQVLHGDPPYIRYPALQQAMEGLATLLLKDTHPVPMVVQCPRMGAGLAGGKWEMIEQMIEQTLVANGIEVTVLTPS